MGSNPHEECGGLIYRWREFVDGYRWLALDASATVQMIFCFARFLSGSSEWDGDFSNFIFSKTALADQENMFEKFGPKQPKRRKRADCNHDFGNCQSKRFPHCDIRTEILILYYYYKVLIFFFFLQCTKWWTFVDYDFGMSTYMKNVSSPLLFCYLGLLLMVRSEKRKAKQAGSEANIEHLEYTQYKWEWLTLQDNLCVLSLEKIQILLRWAELSGQQNHVSRSNIKPVFTQLIIRPHFLKKYTN